MIQHDEFLFIQNMTLCMFHQFFFYSFLYLTYISVSTMIIGRQINIIIIISFDMKLTKNSSKISMLLLLFSVFSLVGVEGGGMG